MLHEFQKFLDLHPCTSRDRIRVPQRLFYQHEIYRGNRSQHWRKRRNWLPRCFDLLGAECINFRALCNVIESFTRAFEEEILGLDVKPAEKDMAVSECASSQQCWAARKPKLTVHVICDSDDEQPLNPATRRVGFVIFGPASSGFATMAFPRDMHWTIKFSIEDILASNLPGGLATLV